MAASPSSPRRRRAASRISSTTVFAALGVLPLVVLGQLGLIVGLGVLLDTLLVRTVLVPALFALIGDRMWWPSRPASVDAAGARVGAGAGAGAGVSA